MVPTRQFAKISDTGQSVFLPGGGSSDTDHNSVPDERETTPGDMTGDGLVTIDDVFDFFACLDGPEVPYGKGCAAADININGTADLADAAAFCQHFTAQ